ncbi:hypothetical protein M0811_08353 [Anaeramoeba ignava]|uniref:Uncharacterized protein n=1 Tax=Anaeramoeba ignava TaxID=1746090 RepID=A0A9Q0LJY0_ANAIG|nr:hypothetical protein M0811_08353 [Anaeramoeba ignava]
MLAIKRALKKYQPQIQEAANRISGLIGKTMEFFFDWDEFMKSSQVEKDDKPKAIEYTVERYIPNIEKAITQIIKDKSGQKVMSVIQKFTIRIIVGETQLRNFSFLFEDDDTTIVFNVLPSQMYYDSSNLEPALRKLLDDTYNLNVWEKNSQAKPIIDEFKKKFTQLIGVEEMKFDIELKLKQFLKSDQVDQDDKGKIFDTIKERYLPNILKAFEGISQNVIGKNMFKNIYKLIIKIHLDNQNSNFSFTLEDEKATLVFNVNASQYYYDSSGLESRLRKLLDDNYNLNIFIASDIAQPQILQFNTKFVKSFELEQFMIELDIQSFLFSTDVDQDDKGKIYNQITERYLPNIFKAYEGIAKDPIGKNVFKNITKLILRTHTDTQNSNFSFTLEDERKTMVFNINYNQYYYDSSGLESRLRKLLDDNYNLNIMLSSNKNETSIIEFNAKFVKSFDLQQFLIELDIQNFLFSTDVDQDDKGKIYNQITERYLPNIFKAFEGIAKDIIGKNIFKNIYKLILRTHTDTQNSNFSFTLEDEKKTMVFNINYNQYYYDSSGLESRLRKLLDDNYNLNVLIENDKMTPLIDKHNQQFKSVPGVDEGFIITLDITSFLFSTNVDQDDKGKIYNQITERYLPNIKKAFEGISKTESGKKVLLMISKLVLRTHTDNQNSNFSFTLEDKDQTLVFNINASQYYYDSSGLESRLRKLLNDNYNLNVWENSSKYEPNINSYSTKFAQLINNEQPIEIRLEMKEFLKSSDIDQDDKGKAFEYISERYLPSILKAYQEVAKTELGKEGLRLFKVVLFRFVSSSLSKSNFSFEYDPESQLLTFFVNHNQAYYSCDGLGSKMQKLLNEIFFLRIKLESIETQKALEQGSLQFSNLISNPFYIMADYTQLLNNSELSVDDKADAIKYVRERYLTGILKQDSGLPHVCRDEDGMEAMRMFSKFIITFNENDQVSNFAVTMDEDSGIFYFWVKPRQFEKLL